MYVVFQALQGKDITIYGNGKQTRSFQFVDDLVEGLIRLMNGNYSQPVNLGNPDEYTVKVLYTCMYVYMYCMNTVVRCVSHQDFAHLIKDLTNSNSTIQILPATKVWNSDIEWVITRIPFFLSNVLHIALNNGFCK